MKSKLLMSLVAVGISAALVAGGTSAAFSDYGTSNDNKFEAGTLDLKVDDGENHDVKFNVKNMVPGNQPRAIYTLKNVGSTEGYLNITNVKVSNNENGITPPETLAGDTTEDVGELGDVVNITLFTDVDGDGWRDAEDEVFYDGKVSNLKDTFVINKKLATNSDVKIAVILNWWDTADDNKAQNDDMAIDLRFDLTQKQK